MREPEARFLKGSGIVVRSMHHLDGEARQGIVIELILQEMVDSSTRLLDRLRDRINARQEKASIRMMAEGPDGFVGGISAHNYRTITDAASATATRDLAELVELGALNRIGERRHARYHLTIANKKGSDFANV